MTSVIPMGLYMFGIPKVPQIFLQYSSMRFYLLNERTDVQKLRLEHRIVGNLIGCLPSLPRQDNLLGLPLQLITEEANLLVTKKLARLVYYQELDQPVKSQLATLREEINQKSFSDQANLYKEERKAQLLRMADKIIEGKRKKRGGEAFDEQEVMNEELKKIPDMEMDLMMVQIFTSNI